MLLVIDNYDSFTYNLVQYLGELGSGMEIYRNDAITIAKMKRKKPDGIIISPGPGTPDDGGISLETIEKFHKSTPILGVCLGHQCIGQYFGGVVKRADRLMHGKTSLIYHDGKDLFKNLDNPFEATRYHSLLVEKDTLPNVFETTAHTDQNEIMGLKHKKYPTYGVQFHPESILTTEGKHLLSNFLKLIEKKK